MINKLYKASNKFFLETEWGPFFGSIWTVGAPPLVGSIIAFGLDRGDITPFLIITCLFLPISLLVYSFTVLIENIVKWCSGYVTHGDYVIENAITRYIFSEYIINDSDDFMGDLFFKRYLFFFNIIFIPWALITLTVYLPYFWSALLFFGVVFGLLKLSRFAYGRSKNLNAHKEDPTAHSDR